MTDLGDLVPLGIEIRGTSGALANASTVILTITEPDGTAELPSVLNPSTGVYKSDFTPTQLGRHIVRWLTSGPTGAFTDTFDVRDVSVRSIISLAEAKRHLNITSSTDDEEMRSMLEAVTYAIERHRNETIPLSTIVETVDSVTGSGLLQMNQRPISRLISVMNGLTSYTIGNWAIDKDNGVISGPSLPVGTVITYVAGYAQVPAHYVLAAKMTLAHLWQTQRLASAGPTGGFGLRNQVGTEPIMTASGLGNALPQRAIELLGPRPSMIV